MIKHYAASRAARLLALIGIILVILVVTFSINMLLRFQNYQAEIERMQPRMAQLSGIQQAKTDIAAAVERANQAVSKVVYSAATDDAALNSEIQNKARTAFTQAGMSVSGSQILAARPAQAVTQLMLDLEASGSLEALESALLALRQSEPAIFVDNMRIEPLSVAPHIKTQGVRAYVRVFAFREGGL